LDDLGAATGCDLGPGLDLLGDCAMDLFESPSGGLGSAMGVAFDSGEWIGGTAVPWLTCIVLQKSPASWFDSSEDPVLRGGSVVPRLS
jgi:hypothetical protein